MANTSTIHIKTDFDCKVYDYGQELGTTKADTFFNVELRKGEHELAFTLKEDASVFKTINYVVEDANCDYRLYIDFTDMICDMLDNVIEDERYIQTKDLKILQVSLKGEGAKLLYKLGHFYETGVELFHIVKEDDIEYVQFENEWALQPDCRKALEFYIKSAIKGYSKAQYDLGLMYEGLCECRGWYHYGDMGSLVIKNDQEAMKWHKLAAEKDNVESQYTVGLFYKKGFGTCKNATEAAKWFSKAAEQGHCHALNELGMCYELGKGVDLDYQKAIECYTQSRTWSAYFNLAHCYFYGIGVEKNYDKVDEIEKKYLEATMNACGPNCSGDGEDDGWDWRGDIFEWYKKAAKQGDAEAQFRLGKLYEEYRNDILDQEDVDSEYIPDNITKAVLWYTKAAKQGHAKAQFELGKCYEEGKGVEEDYQKAIKWYTKASDQGSVTAQQNLINCYYKLGECYEFGYGFEKKPDIAVKWYSKAAEKGHKDAQNAVLRLMLSKTDSIAATMRTSMLSPNTTKNSKPQSKPIKYLFFDTETTGIPKNYDAPTSDSRNWPRLVQLSWITADEDCNVLSKNDHIIYPNGFTIPTDAARVHGITTKIAKGKGEPLNEVIELFHKDYDAAYIIVGHNIDFDKKIVSAELFRLAKRDFILLSTKLTLCTMEASTDYCKIPGYHGYKYPKLQELHKKLFGYEFEDAHNSMSDITATLKCFKEMRKKGLI